MTTDQMDERTFDEQVAEAVRMHIFRAKLKDSTVAAKAGMSRSTLSSRMTGRTKWSAEDVWTVAHALGVSPAVLLPHLDSNQEPSDYVYAQVSALRLVTPWTAPGPTPTPVRSVLHPSQRISVQPTTTSCGLSEPSTADVVDLGAYRAERAS